MAIPLVRPCFPSACGWIAVDAPQWWLDDDELRVVLTDTQANERLAIVKAKRKGDAYDGTVVYQGRRHWIRCRES